MVPRGVANAVLLRLARLTPAAAALARALSALGDGAQVGDAARAGRTRRRRPGSGDGRAGLSWGRCEAGATVRFTHPILRTAIYGDLSPAERERLHRAAAAILRDRGAPARPGRGARHAHRALRQPGAVALLRDAARDALALGDAAGAAALLSRALDEPPAPGDRAAVLLELGQARARAGAPEAIAPLTEIVEQAEDAARDRRGGDRAQRDALLRRPPRRGGGDPAPRPGADPGRRAGARAARGRSAGRQLHLGVGPARSRGRRSPSCGTRAARPATCCRRRRSPRSRWTR